VINLRYHIVSLVAVFLALAVGVLMGSTVLDRGTVALLETSSGQLKSNLDSYRAENDQLRKELDTYRQYGQQILPAQVGGRLRGKQVVIIDTDQVEGPVRDAVRDALRDAGAAYDGRVTFSADRLTLDDEGDRTALAGILGVDDQDPAVLQRALVEKVAERLLGSSPVPRSGKDAASDPLTALRQANFVGGLDLPEPFNDGKTAFPRAGTLFVVLGPASVAADPAPDRFLVPLAGRLAVGSGAPVAAAEATGPNSWLGALRDNDLVSGRVSSVDNVNLVPGQIALVQALQQGLAGLPPGHYGTKGGATKLLPEDPVQ
jgi:hypothetical protein